VDAVESDANLVALRDLVRALVVAVLADGLSQQIEERLFQLSEVDAILRTLRARHARLDAGEVELDHLAVLALAPARHAEEILRLEVSTIRINVLFAPARRAHVLAAFLVGRKVPHRRAVLRRHVGNRRAIRDVQTRRALAVKLDELADDLLPAQQLRHAQDEIGRRHALAQSALEMHANHVGRQEVNRLT
jgi:hypothetical protein